MVTLSLIVPAYNEAERISGAIDTYFDFLAKMYPNDFEMIIVTDGCTDNGPEVARDLTNRLEEVKHMDFPTRLGKGGALRKGLAETRGEIVGFVDADGSMGCETIAQAMKALEVYDVAIASRWLKGSRVHPNQPVFRRVASRAFNLLVRVLLRLPYTDTQCGGKFFKVGALKDVARLVHLTDWAFDVELLLRLRQRGYTIVEVPAVWKWDHDSKLRFWQDSVKMFLAVVGLRIKVSRISSHLPTRIVDFLHRMASSL